MNSTFYLEETPFLEMENRFNLKKDNHLLKHVPSHLLLK